MPWLERLAAVEELEDAPLDRTLISRMERFAPEVAARPIRFSTPTFKSFSSCDLEGCGKNSFPAFSVTAGGCALDCDHCQAKILEPMIPATRPEMLERKVREMIATQDLQGFLLSGGSNRRNEIRYEPYYPVIERLKRDHPHLKVAIHSALLDAPREEIADIPEGVLRDGQTAWASVDAPWLGWADKSMFGALLSDIERLDPSSIISGHLPVASGPMIHTVLGNLIGSMGASRFGGPDRETIEGLFAQPAVA